MSSDLRATSAVMRSRTPDTKRYILITVGFVLFGQHDTPDGMLPNCIGKEHIESAWKGEGPKINGRQLDKPSVFHIQSRPIRFFNYLWSQLVHLKV